MLARFAKPLNDFLIIQIRQGHMHQQSSKRWIFPADAEETAILNQFMLEFPSTIGNPRACPQKSRYSYRINKFNGMVIFTFFVARTPSTMYLTYFWQLRGILKTYGIEPGVALDVWNTVQDNKGFMFSIRVADPEYFLLPVTRFSRQPERHSTSMEDIYQIAVQIGASRRI
jgi:hypothetical protein